MAVKEELLKTLEELGDDEFRNFKWYLNQPDILEGSSVIPKSHLDNADRPKTVDKLVQTYNHQSVEVLKKTLKKINRNDLVEKLSNTSTGEHDVPPPKLLQTITSYQTTLQSNLQDPFKCIQEGWTTKKDEKVLDDIYTELYITAGGDAHITRQLSQIQMASGQPAEPQISNIFTHPSGIKKNIRTVLTNGIAGIGKTFLVHKFVLDWTEKRTNQDVHLIFPFTFSRLNSQRDEVQSFAQFIHTCIHETRYMKQDVLNNIFTTLQTSGNKNFEKSEYKLIFVLDGLDESRLQLDFSANEKLLFDVTKPTSVNVLMTNLIKGTLLPSARLWITTRPAAANQIPPEYVHMVTEVRGFTDPQKEEYFRKKFRDEDQANRIISHIRTSRSLHIMYHTPVYCWITATVLEDVLKSREGGELPKTLTEMYTEFLMIQIKHMKDVYGRERSIQYINTFMKLAFKQLEKDSLIFCEEDLKDESSRSNEVFVYSQVFSQIFKEEHQMKKDGDKMFSFVHLSIVEFLAALYVVLSTINSNKNNSSQSQTMVWGQTPLPEIHIITVDKAVQSLDGHLDLFLRFLLGLSLQTNQTLLQGLLTQTGSSSQTNQLIVNYVKKKIRENPSPDRSINLFHCLNELNDRSLVEEIQLSLRAGSLSTDKLSSAQWSALVFILLSSEKDLDVFDLKKYSASEEALLMLLPVVKTSYKALLSDCNLSERSCKALSSILSSQSSCLRELDLSNNNLQDSGEKLLFAALKSPHCTLETLRLNGCNLSRRCCEVLASVLSSPSSRLRELDLRNNNLTISGEKLLFAALKSSVHCTLETLRTDNIISKSISSGSPAVYQLKPKKEKTGTLTRKTVGEKNLNKKNKTILLVGETGTGKSTLINALLNYTMGVKFEDNIWFEIVEDEKKSQSESQTSDVIVYEIFGFEDETLPFSLTIIDTPGFGDTRGTEKNDIMDEILFELFFSDDGVHEPDAVGLVLKASVNRLSDRLKYIFDSVTSMFGDFLEQNIVALMTYSDGAKPENALKALEAANIKCAKNEKNQPIHFLFNNHLTTQRTEETKLALENAWRVTETGMEGFTDFLEKSNPEKPITELKVSNEHCRITACIQNLQDRIQLIELKQNEIQQTEEALKEHEQEMKKNEEFTVEIDETNKEKERISGGRWFLFYEAAVTCNVCKENCHYPGCTMANNPRQCLVMEAGRCTVCTGKCPASDHVKEKWRYVNKTRKVQKTKKHVKQKYEKNKVDFEQKKSLLENLQTEMEELESEKTQLLDEAYQHVEHLERIALNDNSLSTYDHLDFLIEKMEDKDKGKVQKLKEMKSREDERTRAGMET